MRSTARLLLAGAFAVSAFGLTGPATACDSPPKCATCRIEPQALLSGGDPLYCYN